MLACWFSCNKMKIVLALNRQHVKRRLITRKLLSIRSFSKESLLDGRQLRKKKHGAGIGRKEDLVITLFSLLCCCFFVCFVCLFVYFFVFFFFLGGGGGVLFLEGGGLVLLLVVVLFVCLFVCLFFVLFFFVFFLLFLSFKVTEHWSTTMRVVSEWSLLTEHF